MISHKSCNLVINEEFCHISSKLITSFSDGMNFSELLVL